MNAYESDAANLQVYLRLLPHLKQALAELWALPDEARGGAIDVELHSFTTKTDVYIRRMQRTMQRLYGRVPSADTQLD